MCVKNRTYYFFNDLIFIKDSDPNGIRIDKKYSYLLYWICDDQKRPRKLQCKSFIPFFNKVNGYFKEINGNKYLALVPTNKTKEKVKTYEEYGLKSEI